MKTPATAIENSPMPTISCRAKAASPAALQIWKKRKIAKKAQLVNPPASSAPTSPGASP